MNIVTSVLDTTPTYQPYRVVIAFAAVPFLFFFIFLSIYSCFGKNYDTKRNKSIPYKTRFWKNIPKIVFQYSPCIGISCILWAAVIMIIQAVFIYKHLGLATDLEYYLKIDIPEYETVDLINLAQDSYSLYYYLQNSQVQTPLNNNIDNKFSSIFQETAVSYFASKELEEKENEKYNKKFMKYFSKKVKKSVFPSLPEWKDIFSPQDDDEEEEEKGKSGRRRLSSDTSLALIYHLGDWDNVLLESNLIAACETERNIVQNVDCINFNGGTSLLASVFDENTCQFSISYENALQTISLSDNSDYVEDNLDPSNPESAIIGSLYKVGTCDQISLNSFESQLSDQSVDGTETVYISTPFITSAFEDAIYNGVYVSAIALIFGSLYIFLSVQGFVATLMTLYSILIAIVNAAAVLIDFDYGTFSAFNVLSIFILIGVGGNAVVMFGAAWREIIPRGFTPNVLHFIHVYDKISRPVCFTVCAATISLFSKLISPVIVISQLGAFMGVSVLVFYVCLHYIIIPIWITTGWFHFPKYVHDTMQKAKATITCQRHEDDDEFRDSYQRLQDEEHPESGLTHNQDRPSAYNPQLNAPPPPPEPEAPTYAFDPQGNAVYLIPASAVENVDSEDDDFYNEDRPSNVQETKQKRDLRRRKQLKYAQPTLLKRFATLFTRKEDALLNRPAEGTAPSAVHNRLYSPLLASPVGGANYIPDISEHEGGLPPSFDTRGLITDDPSSLPNNTNNTAVLPTVTNSPDELAISNQKKRKEKYIVKGFSCCVFLLTLCGLLLVTFLIIAKYKLDLGIPQLFPADSNMGQVLYIVKNYKPSLLTSVDSAGSITVVTPSPTFSPNFAPNAAPNIAPNAAPNIAPNAAPNIAPNAAPNIAPNVAPNLPPNVAPNLPPFFVPGSESPTIFATEFPTIFTSEAPTVTNTNSPSAVPTIRPTSDYTNPPQSNNNTDSTDYTINACWGLTATKKYKDSDVNVTYNGQVFAYYVNHGLIYDLKSFCDYVDYNRDYLNVNPTWNKESDCIYYQYNTTYTEVPSYYRNITNTLLYWASLSTTSSKLLGVEDSGQPQKDPNIPAVIITWICANFSARTYVSSLIDDPDLAERIQRRWESGIENAGSYYASQYDVATIISSEEFSFPLLAKEVLLSIMLAILISTVGFFGLLVWFSWGDFCLIILGTLGMIAIFAIAICCHLYLFSATVDLLDVVVLIAIIGIVVDLPIHYVLHFMIERDRRREWKKKLRRKQRLLTNQQRGINNEGEEEDNYDDDDEIDDDQEVLFLYEKERSLALNPALHQSNQYMRVALLHLLILTLICGIPLLFATFVLLQKTGQYIVIIAAVSYFFSILILPYLLAFGFQTKLWKWFTKKCFSKKSRISREERVNEMEQQQIANDNFYYLQTSQSGEQSRDEGEAPFLPPQNDLDDNSSVNTSLTGVPHYQHVYTSNDDRIPARQIRLN